VAGFYLNRPSSVVLCEDETTQIRVLDRAAPTRPILLGLPRRQTHGYVYHRASNFHAALGTALAM